MRSRQGSIRLFRFSGIDVFLHWSWFLVGVFEIQSRAGTYSSIAWNVLEYVALFLIVTLHEFGHALACRQVGGRADTIVLWPLGGVAYVDPPPRPGATLWSITAGPLVNLILVPVLLGIGTFIKSSGLAATTPDLIHLVRSVAWINIALFVFNVLPVYPLDGGQILRSLLWFILGRARSLMVASVFGFLGVAGFIYFAVRVGDAWLGFIALYMGVNCWTGFKQAQALSQLAKLPRRTGYSCPTCKSSPPIGDYWRCHNCGQAFDTFATGAVCPNCHSRFDVTRCPDCGRQHPLSEWAGQTIMVPNPVLK
jgi:Zn-dependent protease/RNA polymerase subunit RPABC4/transcription elongation factor Spt4